MEMQPDPYDYENSSEEFESEFSVPDPSDPSGKKFIMAPSENSKGKEHIINQNVYTNAPIAAGITLSDAPENKSIPYDKIVKISSVER